jgi:hypothetical protein
MTVDPEEVYNTRGANTWTSAVMEAGSCAVSQRGGERDWTPGFVFLRGRLGRTPANVSRRSLGNLPRSRSCPAGARKPAQCRRILRVDGTIADPQEVFVGFGYLLCLIIGRQDCRVVTTQHPQWSDLGSDDVQIPRDNPIEYHRGIGRALIEGSSWFCSHEVIQNGE